MGFGALRADADNPQPGAFDLAVNVAQNASLASASGSEISRVEVQNDRAGAQELGQRPVPCSLIRKGEFRCTFTYLDHNSPSWAYPSPGRASPRAILWHPGPLLLIFRALFRGSSSVGRASRSQCEGRGIDPLLLHQHLRPEQFRPQILGLGSSVDRASAS